MHSKKFENKIELFANCGFSMYFPPFSYFDPRDALLYNHNFNLDKFYHIIGITEKYIKELQKFQNRLVRRVLHLPHSVTQALIDWDVGIWPME